MRVSSYYFIMAIICVVSPFFLQAQYLQPSALRQIQSLLDEKASRTPAQKKISSQLLYAGKMDAGQPISSEVATLRTSIQKDAMGRVKVDIDASITPEIITLLENNFDCIILYASKEFGNITALVPLRNVEQVATIDAVTHIREWIAPINNSGTQLDNYKKITGEDFNYVSTSSNTSTEFVNYLNRGYINKRFQHVRNNLVNAINKIRFDEKKFFAGSVISEADVTHRAAIARSVFGMNGTGIKIGVLSDGVSGIATSQASGDLPPVVTILPGQAGTGSEGRAMLELIHDLAPGAELYFATAFISQASFAQNILNLRAAGCDIIVDDVTYFAEGVFQDDNVAQAVNTVTASGALFFSSAGNSGNKNDNTSGVWEGDYLAGSASAAPFPLTGNFHDFGGSMFNIITVNTGAVSLKWSDPLGLSGNDYDLFVTNSAGTTIFAASTNIQDGNDNPLELFGGSFAGERLYILKKTAAAQRALHLNTNRGQITINTTGVTYGHNAGANTICVAATPAAIANSRAGSTTGPFPGVHTSTNKVEVFSSDGPRRIFFNPDGSEIIPGNLLFATNGGTVLQKPDLTAADGTVTVTPGFTRFYGTSASAPHAGAIAALIKSKIPTLTGSQIKTALINSAIDIETPGVDRDAGAGIIMAYEALLAAGATAPAYIDRSTITTIEGAFSNGNGAVEAGELGSMAIQLLNLGTSDATNVTAVLTTSTPGVTITQNTGTYGNITALGNAINTSSPFLFGINSSVPCGTVINFTLTVTYLGGGVGISPQTFQFSIPIGSLINTISATFGSPVPTGPNFTSTSGTQTGRVNRDGVIPSCASPKASVVLNTASGSRTYHAYSFNNNSTVSQCVTVSISTASPVNIYEVVYNNAGFIPATTNVNYLADQGTTSNTSPFSFTAAPGQQFTVVVHEVNPGGGAGVSYDLNVGLYNCSPPPACTPVVVSPGSLPIGLTGFAYSQSFGATGGSGSYTFSLTGTLPAGLSFSGNTLSGIPTETGTFPLSVTATDVTGCTPATQSLSLVINPGCPTITSLLANPSPACKNANVTLTASGLMHMGAGPYGIEFRWFNAPTATPYIGGTTITTVANGSLGGGGTTATTTTNFTNEGTYYIYAILSPVPTDGSCRPFATSTLVVNPIPLGPIAIVETSGTTNNDGVICSGASVTLTAPAGNSSYVWNTGATTQSITVAPAGPSQFYSVEITNGFGCTNTVSTTIFVNTLPLQFSITGGGAYCNPLGIPNSIGLSGSEESTNYQLFLGASAVGGPVAGTGLPITFGPQAANGTYTVVATRVSTGCQQTMTGTAVVTIVPSPDVNASPATQPVCSGIIINPILLTGSVPGTVFNWTRDKNAEVTGIAAAGSGNISGSLTNTTNAPVTVTFTITPSYTNAGITCNGTPITATVIVNPSPVVIVSGGGTFCGGSIPTITATPGYTYYSWNRYAFPGVIGTTPVLQVSQSGSYNVAVTNSFGCTANNGTTVQIGDFVFNGTITAASPTTANRLFINNTISTCAVPRPCAISGAGGPFPYNLHTVTNPNPNPVCATISANIICNSFTNISAYLGSFNPANICTNYLGDMGHGLLGGTIPFEITIPGGATIVIKVTSISPGSYCNNYELVVDIPRVPPAITSTPGTTICPGTAVTITASPATSHLWSPGGQNTQSITVSPVNTTNYSVTLGYGNNGCTANASQLVTVNPTPNAVATPPTQTICSGFPISNILLSGQVSGTMFNWTRDKNAEATGIASSGSGNIAGTLINTTNAPVTVTFTITPSYTNGGVTCSGTPITATVTVNPMPNAVATPSTQTVCSGLAISNIVLSSQAIGTLFTWTRDKITEATGIGSSGSGNIGGTLTNTTNAPVTVTFTITPSYSNGGVTCNGTPIIANVIVNPIPNAVANVDVQTICSGASINTIDLTSNVAGTSFTWTRNNAAVTGMLMNGAGSNITGTLFNNGVFPSTVTFTITPTYTNGGTSCTGTPITATVTVNPFVVGQITGTAIPFICAGQNGSVSVSLRGIPGFTGVFTITNTNTNAQTQFNWNYFNASGDMTVSIPAALMPNTGATPVDYLIEWVSLSDASGCAAQLWGTATIAVNPGSTVTVNAPSTVCPGANISIGVTNSNGPGTFNWTATAFNGTILANSSGTGVPFGNNAINTNLGLTCTNVNGINPVTFTITPLGGYSIAGRTITE